MDYKKLSRIKDSVDFSDVDSLLEEINIVEGGEFNVDLRGRDVEEIEDYIITKIDEDYYEDPEEKEYDEYRALGPQVGFELEDDILHVSVWLNV